MEVLDKNLLSIFLKECRSLLSEYETIVLHSEQSQTITEHVEELLRIMHTLKGNSLSAGFPELADVAHNQELLLRASPQDHISELLKGVDTFTRILPQSPDTSYQICITFLDTLSDVGEAAQHLESLLKKHCHVIPGSRKGFHKKERKLEALVHTDMDVHTLNEILNLPKVVNSVNITPIEEAKFSSNREITDQSQWLRFIEETAVYELFAKDVFQYLSHVNLNYQLVTINLRKLQQEINFLVSEDSISVTDYQGMGRRIQETMSQLDGLHTFSQLETYLDSLNGLGYFLEKTKAFFLEKRMVSLKVLFNQFRRNVRDMAQKSGKEVAFITRGGDTKIDGDMARDVMDILVHCLRNAMAHGIENPTIRQAGGKMREGRIVLEAKSGRSMVIISVTDDGAGIDTEKLRRKAIAADLISPDRQYTEKELQQLIFRENLSTSETVSSLAGQGIGMSFVGTKVGELLGSIDVHSHKSVGTRIIIYLPASLTLHYGLHVRSGYCEYIIPETIAIRSQHSHSKTSHPIRSIESLMGDNSRDVSQCRYHLIVGNKMHRIALAVDDLIGYEGYAIKPIFLPHLQFIQGVALTLRRSIAFLVSAEIISSALHPVEGG